MKRSLFAAVFLVLLGAGCQSSASITPTATPVPATTKTAPVTTKGADTPAPISASATIGG